jgi:hypothetical protein
MNAKGKAVGFHARSDGIDSPNSRITEQVCHDGSGGDCAALN